ncbi:MAG TPA: fibronectin type III domain-containing protein [Pyrinomonadaceae bacterium]|nr:fibronectin type III domain-containing protein [Pyrinomonadaceae bacterium]
MKFFIVSIFLTVCLTANAAKHVRAGASGTGSGDNWTDAYTTLPSTLTRGETYYVADGTYSGYTFDDEGVGMQTISILKATDAAHGSATGWNSTYGDGPATFTSTLTFTRPNYIFDGVVGAKRSGHGFKVAPTVAGYIINITGTAEYQTINGVQTFIPGTLKTASNTVIRCVEGYYPSRYSPTFVSVNHQSAGLEVKYLVTNLGWSHFDKFTMQHCYIHEIPGYPIRFIGVDNGLIEYTIIEDQWTTTEQHASGLVIRDRACNNWIYRFNEMMNMEKVTGGMTVYNVPHLNWLVYGNVFRGIVTAMGAITSNEHPGGSGSWVNCKFYNNTFDGMQLVNMHGITLYNPSSGNQIYNNIFYRCYWLQLIPNGTEDYNYFSDCRSAGGWLPDGAHDSPWVENPTKRSVITASPFINANSKNYHLNASLSAYPGLALGAPFNVDPDGTTRGGEIWDRGAYEFEAGEADIEAPTTPSNVDAVATSGTTATVTWTASTDNNGVFNYRILRNGSEVGTSTGLSFNDTGLTPATTYTYRVVAADGTGNVSEQSASKSITTQSPDIAAPNAPSQLSATPRSSTSVSLQWLGASDNVGVTGYNVYRGATLAGTAAGVEFTDTGLAPETTYTYTVKAFDAAGNLSTASASAGATTDEAPPFPLDDLELWLKPDVGVTTNTYFKSTADVSVVSSWADQSGNGRHASQATLGSRPIYRAGDLNGNPTLEFNGSSDFLTFNLPVNGETEMTIFLVAKNTEVQAAGASEAERAALFWNETASWGTIYLSPFQATIPFRFGTTQSGNRFIYTRPASIAGAWSITTAVKSNTVDYLFVNGAQVMIQTGRLPTIAGCQAVGNIGRGYNFNTYFYGKYAEILIYFRALTVLEREQVENYLAEKYFSGGSDPEADTTPPTAPTDLVVNPFSPTQLRLTWTASTDDSGISHYTIYRSGVAIGNTTSTSYSDFPLSPDSTHTYYVEATDNNLNRSQPSSSVEESTPELPEASNSPLMRARPNSSTSRLIFRR